jgi:two-component sensor histidine kinase
MPGTGRRSRRRSSWANAKPQSFASQFIAVLAHDLRNPLASIDAGATLLARQKLDEKARMIVGHMQASAKRMSGLVNDMLDFARGRLGGGFPLERDPNACLTSVLDNVVGELRDAWPNRIETHFAISQPVNCDPNRIAQLLSNLAGNALKHGARGGTVRIGASTTDQEFELAVSNQGDPIDPAPIQRLFLLSSPGTVIHPGSWARPLYRVRDRSRSWWRNRCRIVGRPNDVLSAHAEKLTVAHSLQSWGSIHRGGGVSFETTSSAETRIDFFATRMRAPSIPAT